MRESGEVLFDRAAALQSLGDEELLRSSWQLFFEDLQEAMDCLAKALEAGDLPKVAEEAHRLKGGLLYLHARPCAEAANRFQQAARAEDRAKVAEEFRLLKRELERLGEALESGPTSL